MQRVVEELNMIAQIEEFVRLHWLLQSPVVFMTVKNANISRDFCVFKRGSEQFEFFTDLADFLENARVAFKVMRQNSAMKFLIADARLTPGIVKNAIRTA